MKTMKKYIFMAVAGMLALSSCSNDDNDIQDAKNAPRQMTFTASYSDGATTRASLSGKSVSFDAGDDISIFSANNNNVKFHTSSGGATATFYDIYSTATAGDPTYYALYPYNGSYSLSKGNINNVVIPIDQSAAASSACGWDPDAPIAFASTTGSTLEFHNLCALLKITNDLGDGSNIAISFEGHYATGPFYLNLSSVTLEANVLECKYSVKADGVPNGKTIYLAIAPGTYTSLWAMCGGGASGDYGYIEKSSSSTFEAGKIYNLGNTSSWE